jgi:hypothetical protein
MKIRRSTSLIPSGWLVVAHDRSYVVCLHVICGGLLVNVDANATSSSVAECGNNKNNLDSCNPFRLTE